MTFCKVALGQIMSTESSETGTLWEVTLRMPERLGRTFIFLQSGVLVIPLCSSCVCPSRIHVQSALHGGSGSTVRRPREGRVAAHRENAARPGQGCARTALQAPGVVRKGGTLCPCVSCCWHRHGAASLHRAQHTFLQWPRVRDAGWDSEG